MKSNAFKRLRKRKNRESIGRTMLFIISGFFCIMMIAGVSAYVSDGYSWYENSHNYKDVSSHVKMGYSDFFANSPPGLSIEVVCYGDDQVRLYQDATNCGDKGCNGVQVQNPHTVYFYASGFMPSFTCWSYKDGSATSWYTKDCSKCGNAWVGGEEICATCSYSSDVFSWTNTGFVGFEVFIKDPVVNNPVLGDQGQDQDQEENDVLKLEEQAESFFDWLLDLIRSFFRRFGSGSFSRGSGGGGNK
jgi:hypothetical protein